MKNLGNIIGWIVTAIAGLIVLLIIILFAFDVDGDISNLVWTDEMIAEYQKYPEEFRVEYIKVYDERTFTEDGYFSVSKSRYIPALDQWQFTIRYNHSTLEYLGEERGEEMSVDGEHFTFALVDNDGRVYRDFTYKKVTEGRYTYYRLVFDSVSIRKVSDIQIMIYAINDMEGDELPEVSVGKLPLYYSELEREDYNFKKELPEEMKPTEGFLPDEELLKGR